MCRGCSLFVVLTAGILAGAIAFRYFCRLIPQSTDLAFFAAVAVGVLFILVVFAVDAMQRG